MNVCFNGYNEGIVTFECDDTVKSGIPVEVSGNGKVTAAQDKVFCGICLNRRGEYAAVQLSGYAEVGYSGELSVGYNKLISSSGKVKAEETGRSMLVVSVDSTKHTAGIIL